MISAKQFFHQFQATTTNIVSLENYRNGGAEFTQAITEIINDIINKMELRAGNEYLRIDAVGWSDHKELIKDEAAAIKLYPHLWDLEIAVEHENDVTDWTDELIKLLHVSCPLKVIIGYNYCDCRDTLEQKKLSYAAKWMQQVKAFQRNRPAQEQYLIILGNAHAMNGQSSYQSFDYRGYVFDYDVNTFIAL